MRQITIKSALMRTVAVMLFTLGTVSASAQYYMNVVQKDGKKVPFLVSNIDSVFFSDQEGPAIKYEYVDLGLSVNWATFNVGATKPEEFGDHYAWGEISTKTNYTWVNYKFRASGDTHTNIKFSKYNTDIQRGSIDNKKTLDLEDDVAYVKWGGDWRMPSHAEQDELRNNCTWTWETVNGVKGYRVTSKIAGYTDRSIFLPAAGSLSGTDSIDHEMGLYWSNELKPGSSENSWNIRFENGDISAQYYWRHYGRSVRPVRPKNTPNDPTPTKIITSVILDTTSLSLKVGEGYSLKATAWSGNEKVDTATITWETDNRSVATVSTDGLVKAITVGTVTITASSGEKTATCLITVIQFVPEYVDLGLSVNWATVNVGATKPEEFGDHFAWGEISTKTNYTWANYKFRASGDTHTNIKFSKYNTDIQRGSIDNKKTLDLEDDVAYVKWGGDWRMPSHAEQDELRNNCTWTWETVNGVKGYRVTSKIAGYTDRSIFLPAAGSLSGTDSIDHEMGLYWSNELKPGSSENSWNIRFENGDISAQYYWRHYGRSVRPVRPKNTPNDPTPTKIITSVILDTTSLSLKVGEGYSLKATAWSGNEKVDTATITWETDNRSVATVSTDGLVKAIAVGTATITASSGEKTATCSITVIQFVPEYVDLGLSVIWATFNVGATKPEEYGDYYAWGETETKSNYDWSTYKWCNGSSSTLTKYCNNSDYGNDGFTDTRTVLAPEDDVAHVKCGSNWRMPTSAEQDELRNNCTWTWTTLNGVNGYLVTSNKTGYTDRSIFLPAAGWRSGVHVLNHVGSSGLYWSSSLDTDYYAHTAWSMGFGSGSVGTGNNNRDSGFSVRPVCPSEEWFSSFSISFVEDNRTMCVGGSAMLDCDIKHNGEVYNNAPVPVTWSSDNPSVAIVDQNGAVTALSEGIAHISATIRTLSAQCTVTVIQHDYVDLGLSVKWAIYNVGATKPEEYGDYYAWGETETKSNYDWFTYKWSDGSYNTMTKYCNNSDYGNEGFTDTLTVLTPEDDVAHVKWGGSWRMPTKAEQDELRNNCTWIWTTLNGVNGYLVTSNKTGYTDRSIFLPAAGCCDGLGSGGVVYNGDYWSSSLYTGFPIGACYFWFGSDYVGADFHSRYYGFSVRPVCP